jgi:hypothetical protein
VRLNVCFWHKADMAQHISYRLAWGIFASHPRHLKDWLVTTGCPALTQKRSLVRESGKLGLQLGADRRARPPGSRSRLRRQEIERRAKR